MAVQASAERAWQAISRFYENCKSKKPGKKGFHVFNKITAQLSTKPP
jgi:putative transposase